METKVQNRRKFGAVTLFILLVAVIIALVWTVSYVWLGDSATVTVDSSSALDISLYAGAQVDWEIELTDQDFLKPVKNLLKDRAIENYLKDILPKNADPSINQLSQWLAGVFLGGDLLGRFFINLSQIKLVSYRVATTNANDVLAFHDKEFAQWKRNFWAKPSEPVGSDNSFRIYTRGGKNGLQAVAAFIIWSDYNSNANVILLRGR
jgi:hypothetical protein